MRALLAVILASSISPGQAAAERTRGAQALRGGAEHLAKFQVENLNMQKLATLQGEEVSMCAQRILQDIDHLNSASTGSMSKIALWTMKQAVGSMKKLDPYSIGLLGNITVLLDQILDSFEQSAIVDQGVIDSWYDRIISCHNTTLATEAYWRDHVNQTEQNHTNCRADEENLFQIDASMCGVLIAFFNGLYQPVCTLPTATHEHITEWNTLFENGETWFNDTLVGYIPRRDQCIAATVALEEQIFECRSKQQAYESAVCQWRTHEKATCSSIDTCHNHTTTTYIATCAMISPVSHQRTLEAQLIYHVDCLIDNLIQGITDVSLCPLVDLSLLQRFNTTCAAVPAQPACNLSDVEPYPGHQDWADVYVHLSANTPVEDPFYDCA